MEKLQNRFMKYRDRVIAPLFFLAALFALLFGFPDQAVVGLLIAIYFRLSKIAGL